MLHEKIKNIIQTDIENKEFVIETDKGCYFLYGSGFGIISKSDISNYSIISEKLEDIEILDIRSAYGTLIIKLSNGEFIQYAYTGINSDGTGYEVLDIKERSEIDEEFFDFFENDMQKLTKETHVSRDMRS